MDQATLLVAELLWSAAADSCPYQLFVSEENERAPTLEYPVQRETVMLLLIVVDYLTKR